MSEMLALFYNTLPLFMAELFWVDVLSVCLLVFLFYLIIRRRSKIVLEKNIAYNR